MRRTLIAAGIAVAGLGLAACGSGAHSPAASVTHAATSTSATAGCSQINAVLDGVFDGQYAALPPAQTTGDLLNNFLGQSLPVTSAMAPIMAEHGTAAGLRAAEAQLNADVNVLVNLSYVTPDQAGIVLPVLKTISSICGTSAAWTQVTLVPLTVTGG